ncbi:tetratricopeptide repeat family protein [Blastomonas sp. RAC04]|uniref:tetratricopeptide repeat protein n=1 Tax=Blastomonas sp. RAC04 TaxID=1842535 RepID=UPI00083DD471|nr:hypothetical protein [Blastomonas sp. RAC04]AOG00730.1 tetratricopeptide repeat family protein [Blastomonas sp. RAC04]
MTGAWSALRYVIFVAGLGLAWVAFNIAASNNVRLGNPRLAFQYDPTDGQVLANEINRRFIEEKRFIIEGRDMANVQASLAWNPMNRVLLRALAAHYEASGDMKRALSGMQLSSAISKRDTIAQLWLGEFYRRQGNLPSALEHFDYSMSVRPVTSEVVIPSVVRDLGKQFTLPVKLFDPYARRPWFKSFVSTLVGQDPQLAFSLFSSGQIDVRRLGLQATAVDLAYSLIRSGDTDSGIGLLRRIRPKFDPALLRDPRISTQTADPLLGPFAWTFPDDAVQSDYSEQGTLKLTGQVAGRELVASRDIPVPGSGRYQLSFEHADQDDASTKLIWGFQCIGAELVSDLQSAVEPANAQRSGEAVSVDVGSDCRMLRVMLYLDGDGSGATVETQISRLRLSR